MEVLDAAEGRRNTRAFGRRDVGTGIIEKLIEAARWAPSAGNIQSWNSQLSEDLRQKGDLLELLSDNPKSNKLQS